MNCFTRHNSSQFEQIEIIIEANKHEQERDQERSWKKNEERDWERNEERSQQAHLADSET